MLYALAANKLAASIGKEMSILQKSLISRKYKIPSRGNALGVAKKRLFLTAVLALAPLSTYGGTSEGVAPRRNQPEPMIVFSSNRALDGSDNIIFFTPKDRISPGGFAMWNIWVVNTDGSVMPLTRHTAASSSEPMWSPDGSKIVFASSGALDGSDNSNFGFASNIWVMNADGSGAKALTKLTAASSSSPVWSPDGSKIAFVSNRALDGRDAGMIIENIWLMDANGEGVKALTKLSAADSYQPTWSPDSRRIAFLSTRALNGSNSVEGDTTDNIWVMNADGSAAIPLTKLTYGNKPITRTVSGTPIITGRSVLLFHANPTWSPDGSRIAFTSIRPFGDRTKWMHDDPKDWNHIDWGAFFDHSNYTIWTVTADGSDISPLERVVNSGHGTGYPVWSPDGRKLAFSSDRPLEGDLSKKFHDVTNLWVINADGSDATALIGGGGLPAWSPDGKKIAYDNQCNIWTVNIDGSDAASLTKQTRACNGSPRWRPAK